MSLRAIFNKTSECGSLLHTSRTINKPLNIPARDSHTWCRCSVVRKQVGNARLVGAVTISAPHSHDASKGIKLPGETGLAGRIPLHCNVWWCSNHRLSSQVARETMAELVSNGNNHEKRVRVPIGVVASREKLLHHLFFGVSYISCRRRNAINTR